MKPALTGGFAPIFANMITPEKHRAGLGGNPGTCQHTHIRHPQLLSDGLKPPKPTPNTLLSAAHEGWGTTRSSATFQAFASTTNNSEARPEFLSLTGLDL